MKRFKRKRKENENKKNENDRRGREDIQVKRVKKKQVDKQESNMDGGKYNLPCENIMPPRNNATWLNCTPRNKPCVM